MPTEKHIGIILFTLVFFIKAQQYEKPPVFKLFYDAAIYSRNAGFAYTRGAAPTTQLGRVLAPAGPSDFANGSVRQPEECWQLVDLSCVGFKRVRE